MIFSIICLLTFSGAYAQIGSPILPSIPSVFPNFPNFPGLSPNTNPVQTFVSTFMPWLVPNQQQQQFQKTIGGLPSGGQIVNSLLAPWLNPNNLQAFANLPPFIRPGQIIPGLNAFNRPEATEPETSLPSPAVTNNNPLQIPNAENIDLQHVVPGVPNLPGSNLIAGTQDA